MSSFDIIRRLRSQTGISKIGHAGTLDPAATGLMLILIGRATKQARNLTDLDKEYEGEILLGKTSSTGDRDGTITTGSQKRPDFANVDSALQTFVGDIKQVPSVYSAIKIHGVRAYKLARAGRSPVTMPSRDVTIYRIELLNYDYPVIHINAVVSSGTYIRSLAVDVGEKLETGAYLSALKRVRIGSYQLAAAHQLQAITESNLPDQLITLT